MSDLEGKAVLVTGGGSGIGLASCKALADAGAEVIIADRDADAAEQAEARAAGGKATAYRVDVAVVPQGRAVFDFVAEAHGKLSVLFSHAGAQGPTGLEISEERFDATIDANLKSHFFAGRYALPLLRRGAPGRRSSTRPRRPGCGHLGALLFTEPARPAFSC